MKNKLGGGKPCNAGLWQLSVGYQGAQYFLSLSSVQGFHWPSPESLVQHLQFQAEMSTVSLLLCQIFAHFHFVSSSLFVCVCIAKHLSCFPNDMALQSGLIYLIEDWHLLYLQAQHSVHLPGQKESEVRHCNFK
jgi:hypothetical protein